MKEKKYIEINGFIYSYTLHIKKMKNIVLKIEQGGEIVVSANAYIPQIKIDTFLKEKIAWIIKKQKEKHEKQVTLYDDCLSQDNFYLFGKKYRLICIHSNKNDVGIDDTTIYVYYKKEREDCLKTMRKFIKKICEQNLIPIVDVYYAKLNDYTFEYPVVKFRTMKSRWGSCATNKAIITLNTYLIHYPKAFIEYVVLHELVHFIQPNHSKQFYQIIENYMPDYKDRMKLIKG